MKKKLLFLLMGSLMSVMCGCANVSISSPGSLSGVDLLDSPTPCDRAVVINNSGIFLFWNITLGSGDLRWDETKNDIKGGTAFFQDYSGVCDLVDVLDKIAKRENCDVVSVTAMNRSDSDLQLMSYQGLAMGLIGCNSVTLSAVLRQKSPEVPQK